MKSQLQHLHHSWRFRSLQEQFRREQGRLTAAEAAQKFGDIGLIPLCQMQRAKGKSMTIRLKSSLPGSHLLVVAPPGSKSVAQSVHCLWEWPGAALVVDPGGILHANTAAWRQRFVGPVYALPGHQIDLGAYYRFWNETQAQKLHHYLMSPYPPEDASRMTRSISLYVAVGHYAYAHKRNPLQLLLDVAACDLLGVLQGLETVPYARLYVRQFTKGLEPHAALRDDDVLDAFDQFVYQMRRYQEHYGLFATEPAEAVLPLTWAQAKSTLYLTYDLLRRQEMGGLVTAVVTGLIRHHFSHGNYRSLLVIMDEATASQIPHFATMLTMAANYGVTIVLIATSWQGLKTVFDYKQADHLLLHFHHQLWYPPRDGETAGQMSKLLGEQLAKKTLEKEPAVSPTEIEGWSAEQVLAISMQDRPYRFVGQPLAFPEEARFQPAPLMRPISAPAPRERLGWLPPIPIRAALLTSPPQPKKLPAPSVTIVESNPKEKQPQSSKRKGWK
jgi:hypothetical protein